MAIEREQPTGSIYTEIPLVNWPIEGLTPEIIGSIVHDSRFKPLREIIARILIQEGENLYEKLKTKVSGNSQIDDTAVIAVNEGYAGAGKAILLASKHMEDGQGQVGQQTSAISYHFKDDSESQRHIDFAKKVFKRQRRKAVQSLSIDPTGFDWLRLTLEKDRRDWNSMSTGKYSTSEDPQVIGLRIGIDRYKQLYNHALLAGAAPDKVSNVTQISAKARRILRIG